MPWENRKAELLRMEFVMLASHVGVNKSQLCREFGISRKTGYKWLNRYCTEGIKGLETRSHRPKNSPTAIPGGIVADVIRLRHLHPNWGPKKLRVLMLRAKYNPKDIPSVSSLVRILHRAGLSVPKGRGRPRKYTPTGKLSNASKPNDVWTVDLKGWWQTQDGNRCEPLTVRDLFSRYILCLKPLKRRSVEEVKAIFDDIFKSYGLPEIIRSDNGSPFASTRNLHGLTRLSAWWLSLGIQPEHSRLGHPEDNGAHERMHADIAREIQKNPAPTVKDEEVRLENWRREFNNIRPHESLKMLTPSQIYRPSSKFYGGLFRDYEYPAQFEVRMVKKNGSIKYKGKEMNLSGAVVGYKVGIEKVNDVTFRVWFCNLRWNDFSFSSDSSFQ